MQETTVEKALCRNLKGLGGIAYKFVSPGRRNVPDRLCLLPIGNEKHAAIVASYLRFVECKKPGEKPNAGQRREHAKIRKLGFRVDVVDSVF